MASLGLLKIKVFLNKVFDIIISLYDATNKVSLRDSDFIVDFQFYKDLTRETRYFEGWSWFNSII